MSSPARSRLLVPSTELAVAVTTFLTVGTGSTAVLRDWWFYNGGGANALVWISTLIDGTTRRIGRFSVTANAPAYSNQRLCLESGHALRVECDRGSAVIMAIAGALLTA